MMLALSSEIGQIQRAFKLALAAFYLRMARSILVHAFDAESADGAVQIPFFHAFDFLSG